MNVTSNGIKRTMVEFDSLDEMMGVVLDRWKGLMVDARNAPFFERRLAEMSVHPQLQQRSMRDFYDGKDLATMTAERLDVPREYLDGVESFKRMLQGLLDDVAPIGSVRRRKIKRGLDDGDEVDADAWLQRRTDCWTSVVKSSRPHRVIRIACNVSTNHRMRPHELFCRGAAAVALADIAAGMGFSASLDMVKRTEALSDEQAEVLVVVPMKREREVLDVGKVAYAMASVAFYRMVLIQVLLVFSRGKVRTAVGFPAAVGSMPGYDVVIDSTATTTGAAVASVASAIEAIKAGRQALV